MSNLSFYSWLVILVDWLIKLYVCQQISNLHLQRKQIGLLLLGISLTYLLSPKIGLLLEPVYLPFFMAVGPRPHFTKSQFIYYTCLPFIVVDLVQRQMGLYQAKYLLVMETPNFQDGFWLTLSGFMFLLLIYFLFIKVMTVDFRLINQMMQHARFARLFKVLNAGLLSYALVFHPLLALSGTQQKAELMWKNGSSEVSFDLVYAYLLLFISGLVYLNYRSRTLLFQELQAIKDNQLQALTSYSQHVESLYEELRSFRHDYTNILTSLQDTLARDDLAGAKAVYASVLAGTDRSFYQSKYDIARLSYVQNPAIKSVLSAKLFEAQAAGLIISLEVPELISDPPMEVLDFLQMLSIFLDNAIEAAQESEQKKLDVAYFSEQGEQVLVIANSTVQERVNTKAIFARGVSSKGSDRGLGLANVKAILAKFPNVQLTTESQPYQFIQLLRLKE